MCDSVLSVGVWLVEWKVYGNADGLVSREEMEAELALVEEGERVEERLRLSDISSDTTEQCYSLDRR